MLHVLFLCATVLTKLSDLSSVVTADDQTCRSEFCITGAVSYVIGYHQNFYHLLLEEGETGIDITGVITAHPPQTGDIVRLQGAVVPFGPSSVQPQFETVETIGHCVPGGSRQASAAEIMSGRHDFRRASLVGEVRDVEPSGSDPCWNYLSIISDGQLYYAPIPRRGASLKQLEDLIGATVRLDGFPDSHNCSYRFLDERRFMVADFSHITVLSPPPPDPFSSAPSIDELHRVSPERIARLGRHRTTGRLLTVWQKRNALFLLEDGRMALLSTANPLTLPRGQTADVIGYPTTDGFTLRLSRAIVRAAGGNSFDEPTVTPFSEENIKRQFSESTPGKTRLQGERLRFRGTVADFNDSQRERRTFSLAIGDYRLDVDFSALPEEDHELAVGCRVLVTGTCVLTTENWTALSEGAQLNGILLVLDRTGDLKILERPPWWTPARLTITIVILLLTLLSCLVWNRLLHRLSEKRGQELFRERSASALAELKTEERTRLAVELHDSISQILTGAAMQLDAGEIGAAKRILASCRRELRSCLWDLRSHAMDTEDFADAVRETIAPHLGNRPATIDFDIPSSALSEPLRYAALRIIREATANAIRHGHAQTIAISGEFRENRFTFTVVDDGRGFDPSITHTSANGHFGLLGMRERAKAFNGSVTIASTPGSGTEVTVVLEEQSRAGIENEKRS